MMTLMQWIELFFFSLWDILVELAPWLLLGLIAAGLIRALLPMRVAARYLGGRGLGATLRAAVLGAPLPLCSCSVLPAAVSLRRAGASRSATTAFLISTPETGVDSLAVSYALLGPLMMLARLVSTLASAVTIGVLVGLTPAPTAPKPAAAPSGCGSGGCNGDDRPDADVCCDGDDCCDDEPDSTLPLGRRLVEAMRYATTTLLDDLLLWLILGVLAAAAVSAFVPADTLATWGSGWTAMLAMVLIGVPMYICATASTPVAAALLSAGVSPGTVLVFLLAGPATNFATIGVVRQEFGSFAAAIYVTGIAAASIACGLAIDAIFTALHITITPTWTENHALLPLWLSLPCLALLALLAIKPLRTAVLQRLIPQRTTVQPSTT